MKKFLITSFLVVATVIGAAAQISFQPTGQNDFTNLTVSNSTTSLASPYTQARLLLGVQGFTFPPRGGPPTFQPPAGELYNFSITLSGDGLTNNTPVADFSIFSNMADPNNFGTYTFSAPIIFSTPINTWNSANTRVNFSTFTLNNAFASPGARIFYAVQYGDASFGQLNTSPGNLTITAVPEPSTYVAAAGLLALFLWSSRRHLFKLAGARSSASGPDENGAA